MPGTFSRKRMLSPPGTGCAILFLLPFACVGLFMAGLMGRQLWFWHAASQWTERPCELTVVKLEVKPGDDAPTYLTTAEYRYEFANRQYEGSTVSFSSGSDNVGSFHQRVYDELELCRSQGRPFHCFVNPADPSQSVLYRDLRPEMLLFYMIFVLAFGGIGIGGLTALSFQVRKTRRMKARAAMYPEEPWQWDVRTARGEFVPRSSWMGQATLAFFWNSIAWPASGVCLYDEKARRAGWVWLILIFPLAGLVPVWMSVQSGLRRWRFGRPVLTVEPWPYSPGNVLKGTIEFLHDIPASVELTVDLRVVEPVPGDDPDRELLRETVRVPNTGQRLTFQLNPPDHLPRTGRLLDVGPVKTAKWILRVKSADDIREIDLTYDLAVFERTLEPAAS